MIFAPTGDFDEDGTAQAFEEASEAHHPSGAARARAGDRPATLATPIEAGVCFGEKGSRI
jgi:hypothetical protein